MSTDDYVNKIRAARDKVAVLKATVLQIRSGVNGRRPLLIFEGKTDIGPYEVWIRKINHQASFNVTHASGKKQLLEFRDSIFNTTSDDFDEIYFIVDYDFDGLQGKREGDDIYCLDRYSVENYLVSDRVLISVLNDELECSDFPKDVQAAVDLYQKISQKFCASMNYLNFHLYVMSKKSLSSHPINKKLSVYLDISLTEVSRKLSDSEIDVITSITENVEESEIIDLWEKFSSIGDPMMSHRGKFIYEFFLSWLDRLAEARRNGEEVFSIPRDIKYSRQALSMRSLATRSEIPNGLHDFVGLFARAG